MPRPRCAAHTDAYVIWIAPRSACAVRGTRFLPLWWEDETSTAESSPAMMAGMRSLSVGVAFFLVSASACGGDDTGDACDTNDPASCRGDNICVAGTCESAFDRNYVLTAVHAEADATRYDGV